MIDFRKMRELMREEEHLRWSVEKQQARATKITADISDMPRGGQGMDREDVIIELATRREEHRAVEEELRKQRAELKTETRRLKNSVYRQVIRLRYMQGKKPGQIARDLRYSERQIYRMLELAESKINQRIAARLRNKKMSEHVTE